MMAITARRRRTLWRLVGGRAGIRGALGRRNWCATSLRRFRRTEWIAGEDYAVWAMRSLRAERGELRLRAGGACLPRVGLGNAGRHRNRLVRDFCVAGAKLIRPGLRTKQGYLAEGLPLLRDALREIAGEERRARGKSRSDSPGEHRSDSTVRETFAVFRGD